MITWDEVDEIRKYWRGGAYRLSNVENFMETYNAEVFVK